MTILEKDLHVSFELQSVVQPAYRLPGLLLRKSTLEPLTSCS